MLKIREIKTGSGKTAIQVYYLYNRKRVIVKHLGSSMTNEELDNLKQQAQQFIEDYSSQTSLFTSLKGAAYSYLDHYECIGFYYCFFYDTIQRLIAQIGFEELTSNLFKDLVIIRILEPRPLHVQCTLACTNLRQEVKSVGKGIKSNFFIE